MLYKECLINHSKIMNDYFHNSEMRATYFDYSFHDTDFYYRNKELQERSFQREDLQDYFLAFNQKYGCSAKTTRNIEKFTDPNCVAIVGGQQAGILTGPLYTIHKIITIVQLAKQQEEKLQVPVIPIFWIAGEDHDFEEINHIYNCKDGKLIKRKFSSFHNNKRSISELPLQRKKVQSFIEEVLSDYSETENTNVLIEKLNDALENSHTFIDFFCLLIHDLFADSGIVLLDSHDSRLRKFEVPFFKEIIEKNAPLSACFMNSANKLFEEQYGEPVERNANNAHLFFHSNGKRLLLERVGDAFTDKERTATIQTERLLDLLVKDPSQFSNNVVTRPLMQEYLLPVLAFVGGPGEIAYWATLKSSFHLFGYKVPPVVPRHSITIMERKVDKLLQELNLSFDSMMNEGLESHIQLLPLWDELKTIEKSFEKALDDLENIHLPLRDLVTSYNRGLGGYALKNKMMIEDELRKFSKVIEKSVRQKYEHERLKFDIVEGNVKPHSGLQERRLNIIYYLNAYGFDWLYELQNTPFQINEYHKIFYIN